MAYIGNSCIYVGSNEWGIGSEDGEEVPVAVVSPSELSVAINEVVRLDASGSYSDDPDILYYQWEILQKPLGSTITLIQDGAEVSFIADVSGSYLISLVVRGAKTGCSDPLIVTINASQTQAAWSQKHYVDYSWIWQLLPDFWNLVPGNDRAKVENFWNGLGQIASSDLLKLYNIDGNKSISTIQERVLARWMKIDPILDLEDTIFIFNEPTDVAVTSDGSSVCQVGTFPLETANPRIPVTFLNPFTIVPSESLLSDIDCTIRFTHEGRPYERKITVVVDGQWQVSPRLPFDQYPVSGFCDFVKKSATDVFYADGLIETITKRVDTELTLTNSINAEQGTFFCVLKTPIDYTKKGVSAGDILISNVTDVTGNISIPLRSEIVAVNSSRILLRPAIDADWITPEDAALAEEKFGITVSAFSKVFNLPRFRWRYFNTELRFNDLLTVGDYSFRITPAKILRNTRIEIPRKVLSVLTLNEFITDVTVSEGKVYSEFGSTLDLGRDQISFTQNNQYVVTNLDLVGGGLNAAADSLTVTSDTLDFELYEVLAGDTLSITTGGSIGEYLITAVDGFTLTLKSAVPREVIEDDFRVIRAVPANFIKFNSQFSWSNPCPTLWAETYVLDNNDAIEATFGNSVRLTNDEYASWRTYNSYRSVVESLLRVKMLGPNFETFARAVSTAIGLPVAKARGIIRNIEHNILRNNTRGRVAIEDLDSSGVPTGFFRIYTLRDLTDDAFAPLSGLSINPRTGRVWAEGDVVESGEVLSNGVVIEDRYTAKDFPVAGVLGYHVFRILVDSDSVPLQLRTLQYLVSYVREIRPHYVWIVLAIVKYLVDYINIETEIMFKMRTRLFDDAYHIDFGANIFDEYLHLFQRFDARKASIRTLWPTNDLQIRAGGIVYSTTGGFVTPPDYVDFGGEPTVIGGDVLLIENGPYQGIYTITSVIDDNTLQTDSDIFIVDDDTTSRFKVGRLRIGVTARSFTRDIAVQELLYPGESLKNIDIAPGDLINIDANTHVVTAINMADDSIRIEPGILDIEVDATVVRPWTRQSLLFAGNVASTGEYLGIDGREYGVLVGDTVEDSNGRQYPVVAMSEDGYVYVYPKIPAGVVAVKIRSKLNSDDVDAVDRTLRKIEELVMFKFKGAGGDIIENYVLFGPAFSLVNYPAKVGDIIYIPVEAVDVGEGAGVFRVVDIDAGGVYTNYAFPSPKTAGFELWKHTPGWIREI
jgi:hypothetical protein